MNPNDIVTLGPAPLPGNNGYTILVDSTRYLMEPRGPHTANPDPGRFRGKWSGWRVEGGIATTGQDVTLLFQILEDRTATAAASWKTDTTTAPGSGSVTITAAADAYRFNWMPNGSEFRVLVDAGATGPTTMPNWIRLLPDREPGA